MYFVLRGGPFLRTFFSNLHEVQIRVGGSVEEYWSCKLHNDK